jgi:hypothetical protein
MFSKILSRAKSYWTFFFVELPMRYRQKYTLLYPHGLLRKVARKYPDFGGIEVFVESGTFKGKTAIVESRFFREVHTIELSPELYRANLAVFQRDFPNIFAYEGDSASVLQELVMKIKEPCLFFLDAHWSGDHRVNWQESEWKGYATDTAYRGDNWPPTSEQQCPLIDESEVIGRLFKFPAIVVIDDWLIVGTRNKAFAGEDWSSISIDRILDGLGRERVLDYFETEYAGKRRMNIVMAGKQ